MAAGAQIATSSTAIGGSQPPAGPAPSPGPAPGTRSTASEHGEGGGRDAGHGGAARPRPAAIWRSDAPRARHIVSSADRRMATMRAASRRTTRPATARLTYSSHSRMSTAWAVARNAASGWQQAGGDLQRAGGGRDVPGQRRRLGAEPVQRVVKRLGLLPVEGAERPSGTPTAGPVPPGRSPAAPRRYRPGPANTSPTQNAERGGGHLQVRGEHGRVGGPERRRRVARHHDPGDDQRDGFQAARELDLRAADLHRRAQVQAELPGCLR